DLGALLWALKLGACDDDRLRLGMGKPLGMGAVKTEAALALTDRRARYAALFTDDGAYWQLGAKKVWASDGQPLNLPDLAAKLSRNFESFIVQHDGNAFSGGRLNQLLALLHWPGPPADKTAYMGLGEFKKWPVLPKPTNVHPHRRAKKQTYPIYFVFRAKIPTRWDGKRQGFGVEMPNGEAGILKWASKKVMSRELAKLKEDTVELVVARFENGLYYLELY
ncbi:MAG: hypothetical protein ACE5G8_16310, partial [Anaerolineae bacterium]